MGRKSLFLAAGAVSVAFAAIGAALSLSGGLPQRMAPETGQRVSQFLAAEADINPLRTSCPDQPDMAQMQAGTLCRLGAANAQPDFLLWGDSHADALAPAIARLAEQHGRAGQWAYQTGCPPLLRVHVSTAPNCDAHNAAILKLALRPEIRDIFLHALWAQGMEGTVYTTKGPAEILADAETPMLLQTSANNMAAFRRGLERTIRTLTQAGKRVVIVASVPEQKWDIPEEMAKNAFWGRGLEFRISTQAFMTRQQNSFSEFDRLRLLYGAEIVYPHRALCDANLCAVEMKGRPFYRDMHHLSTYGALHVAPVLEAGLFPKDHDPPR